jgi:hypothetical protein
MEANRSQLVIPDHPSDPTITAPEIVNTVAVPRGHSFAASTRIAALCR